MSSVKIGFRKVIINTRGEAALYIRVIKNWKP